MGLKLQSILESLNCSASISGQLRIEVQALGIVRIMHQSIGNQLESLVTFSIL